MLYGRRDFFGISAAASIAPRDIRAIRMRRVGRVETAFRSPGPHPNGLQAAAEGLWIMDQGDNKAYLVDYGGGKVVREFNTAADRASGITFDGQALWIGSTYNREIICCDAKTGSTISRHFTPGAGVIYKTTWDPPQRTSPLAKKEAVPPAASPVPSSPPQTLGTGAHGQEWREGKLWMAVPPSRMIYRLDPKSWIVERQFPTAGNRPHGIAWEGRFLWCTDSNLNAFFKHDPETGEIIERIQLADSDPLPHGMTIRDNVLWYCDDVGLVCKLRL